MTDTTAFRPLRSRQRADSAAARRLELPTVPPWLLITAALLTAALMGRLLASGELKYGVALVVLAGFLPLVLFDLTRALAVWVAILFFTDLKVLSSGPNAVGVLVGLGWLGTFLSRPGTGVLIRQNLRLLLTITCFCLYMTLTIAWATNAGDAGNAAGYWWLAALTFLVVLTTISRPGEVRIIAMAFVVGSVISVLIGVATGGLEAASTTVTQTTLQGRLTGGGGDPNVQAAGYVAALFLTLGLFSVYRTRASRALLLGAFVLISIGFFGTQSRGGLVALAVASVAALFLAPRQRARILGLLAIVALAGVTLVATTPGALTRITDLSGGSSGRSDLWRVGWDVFSGHPIFGIGGANFMVVESHYVLRPGSINRIQYLTDIPYFVHNTYLQLLAETGIVGLLGFLAVVIGCLRAAYLAAKRFDRIGRSDHADLTRAVMMGTIAMLVALFLITDGDDQRLWVLLALGPVMLAAAARASAPGRPPSVARSAAAPPAPAVVSRR